MDFSQSDLLDHFENTSQAEFDRLDFGVIKLDSSGNVLEYNIYESRATGLSRDRVVGRHFFSEIGGCMNNPQIAGRFERDSSLDIEFDYIFALRMQIEPVRLRLLKSVHATAMYLLVKRSNR